MVLSESSLSPVPDWSIALNETLALLILSLYPLD